MLPPAGLAWECAEVDLDFPDGKASVHAIQLVALSPNSLVRREEGTRTQVSLICPAWCSQARPQDHLAQMPTLALRL